jgi:hypothetical protein
MNKEKMVFMIRIFDGDGLRGEFVTSTTGTVFPAAGTGIADDGFGPRVPCDRPVESLGNSGELADGGRAVTDFRIADRPFSRPHAFKPVLLVIIGLVETNVIR